MQCLDEVMKITLDITDSLLREVREPAVRKGVTLESLIERGLHNVVSEAKQVSPFKLRRASFKGKGLRAEPNDSSWDALLDLTYEGRGN